MVHSGNAPSPLFNVTNGLSQGVVLLSISMDDLSEWLADTQVGCTLNNFIFNYMVLLDPSLDALQDLLVRSIWMICSWPLDDI